MMGTAYPRAAARSSAGAPNRGDPVILTNYLSCSTTRWPIVIAYARRLSTGLFGNLRPVFGCGTEGIRDKLVQG